MQVHSSFGGIPAAEIEILNQVQDDRRSEAFQEGKEKTQEV